MAYNRIYTLTLFDSATAVLYVDIQTVNTESGWVVSGDYNIPIRLPVDGEGNVPTGADLTAIIESYVDRVTPDRRLRAIEETARIAAGFGGAVQNAAGVEAVTAGGGSGGGGTILVSLQPDFNYRDPVTGLVTRSVMIRIASRGDINGADYQAENNYGIDNGNIANATLTEVLSPLQAGPFSIADWIDPAPEGILAQYPDINNIATGYVYYIEHDPIVMYNYTTAIFTYA